MSKPNFTGILKLKKDPKPEEVTAKNIVFKDSVVQSKWFVGLVLNTYDEFDHLANLSLPKRGNPFSRLTKILLYFSLINLVLVYLLSIIRMNFSEFTAVKFINFFYITLAHVPMGVDVIMKLALVFKSINLKNRFHIIKEEFFSKTGVEADNDSMDDAFGQVSKSKTEKDVLEVFCPFILPNLGNARACLFSKHPSFSRQRFRIKTVSTNEAYYKISYKENEGKQENEDDEDMSPNPRLSDKIDESKTPTDMSNILTESNDNLAVRVGKITKKENKSKFHQSNEPEDEENFNNLMHNIEKGETELGRRTTNQIYQKALALGFGSQDSRELSNRDQIPSNPYILNQKSIVFRKTHMFIEDVYKAYSQHKFKTVNHLADSQFVEQTAKKINEFKEQVLYLSEYDNNDISNKHQELLDRLQTLNMIVDFSLLSRNKNFNDATVNFLDAAILKFGRSFNFRVEKVKSSPSSEIGYMVDTCISHLKSSINVLGVDEFHQDLKVIVKDEITQRATLFIRCTKKYLYKRYIDRISSCQNLQKIILSNDEKYLKSYFYLAKELSDEEIELFSNLLTKLSDKVVDKAECFKQLMDKITPGKVFDLYLTIGVKERLVQRPKIFEELRLNDMRLAYFTNEGYLSAMNLAWKFNLLDRSAKKPQRILFNFDEENAGNVAFKEALEMFENMNNQLFKQMTSRTPKGSKSSAMYQGGKAIGIHEPEVSDFNIDAVVSDVHSKETGRGSGSQRKSKLVIKLNDSQPAPDNRSQKIEIIVSGKTLKLILANPYFYYHFKLLINFSSVIVAYKMDAENRFLLTQLIKSVNKNGEVICIGCGDKDARMMETSDVGIQMLTRNSLVYQGNVVFSKISDLSYLLFEEGKQLYVNCLKFLAFAVFCSSIWLAQAFVNEIKMKAASDYYPNAFILMVNHFAIWVLGIFLIVFNKNAFTEKIVQYKVLYLEHIYTSNNFVYQILVQGTEGFILGLLCYLGFSYFTNSWILGSTTKLVPMMLLTAVLILFKAFFVINAKSYILMPILITGLVGFLFATFKLCIDNLFIFTEFALADAFNSASLWIVFIGLLILGVHIMGMIHYSGDRFMMEPLLGLIAQKARDRILFSVNQIYNFVKLEYKPTKISHYIFSLFSLPQLMDSSLANVLNPSEIFFGEIGINRFSLRIENTYLENNFVLFHKFKKYKIDVRLLFIFSVIILINLMGFISPNDNENQDLFQLFSTIIYFVILMISLNLVLRQIRSNKTKVLAFGSVWIVLLINFFKSINYVTIFGLMFLYLITYLENINYLFYAIGAFLLTVSYFVCYLCNKLVVDPSVGALLDFILLTIDDFVIFFCLVAVVSASKYIRDRQKKKNFLLSISLQHKKNYNNELLNLLMPKFVLSRISYNVNETCLAEDAGTVAIVFVEICNFNDILNHHKENIILFLDQLFKDFDTECEKFGVQKIETVGKTYLASCGIKFIEEKLGKKLRSLPPIRRIFDYALSLMKIAENYSYQDGKPIKLKIGINEGRCMMGVLGYHKPQFSLIGDTINTTSRLCTTGEMGHIMLSEESFAGVSAFPLSSDLIVKPYSTYMKGKGDVQVIHVFHKENKLKALIISAVSRLSQSIHQPIVKSPNPAGSQYNFTEIVRKDSLRLNYSRSLSKEIKQQMQPGTTNNLAVNSSAFNDVEIKALVKLAKFGKRNNIFDILKYTHIIASMMKLNKANQKIAQTQKKPALESKQDTNQSPKAKQNVKDNFTKQEASVNHKRNSLMNSFSISNKLSSLNASNHSITEEDFDGVESNEFEDNTVN